tara:strand:- start:139 stop:570 length:432 start_codon:yes stop_codon:yes gene_type:complete
MVVSNKRQARYITTFKGKAASLRSKLKSQKIKRMSAKGRLELRIIRIKSIWGHRVAEWFEKQKSICVTCGRKKDKAPARIKGQGRLNQLVIDHDHKYKQQQYKKSKVLLPRGLLCHACNIAFGLTEEKIKTLKNMVAYKEKHS